MQTVPAQAASQCWCGETGHERLLTQVGLFAMFLSSSYLQFELLMLSVVCGWRLSLLVLLEKKGDHFSCGPVTGA